MSENAQNTNTFKFFHNAETRLYIESVKEKENSIFSDVYRAFFNELNEKLADISDKKDVELRNNLNNIFAFVGDRGSGKTSCMLSVAKMMAENEKKPIPEFGENKTEFCVLESIDPSFFDEYTNILDIVLGRMFSDFRKKWEDGSQNRINEKNQLLESFEIVKRTISQMNAKKNKDEKFLCEEDNVERLINLGASVNLKSDIYKLIQNYLKFFGKKFLVVPIDDIDLHSQCAYEMVEQIRKYLIQYNVIVLMALKIDQLDKVVEKAYLKNFSEMLPKKLLSVDQIADMANKYLIKLIPDSQRFVLPTIEVMYNRKVEIYKKSEKTDNSDSDFLGEKWERDDSNSGYPARYIVLKLIFDKTRYLFYHMQGATSLIIPHTLREYNHLLEILVSMDDYDKIALISDKQRNKSVFNLDDRNNKDRQLLKELVPIFDESNKTYGYRRIHSELSRTGRTVSEKVVRRAMKLGNLVVYKPKKLKYSSYKGEITPAVPNILNRNFHADAPNQKWLTDITEFPLHDGKVYLSPIIDCFDGAPVCWTIGESPDATLVDEMLDKAVATLHEGEAPIIHTDRGSHYRWPGWIERMKKYGLTRSMSRKGYTPDNAACEGFFGILKNEFFYSRNWRKVDKEEFKAELEKYLEWFCSKRIKVGLNGMSPADYRKLYLDKQSV